MPRGKSTVSSPAFNLRIASLRTLGRFCNKLFKRARGREEAPTRAGDRRSRALARPGEGCRPLTFDCRQPAGPTIPPCAATSLLTTRCLCIFRPLEHEVDPDRVVEIRRTSAAAVMSLAAAIEQVLSPLGRSGDSTSFLPRLLIVGGLSWQIARAAEANRRYAENGRSHPSGTSISHQRPPDCYPRRSRVQFDCAKPQHDNLSARP